MASTAQSLLQLFSSMEEEEEDGHTVEVCVDCKERLRPLTHIQNLENRAKHWQKAYDAEGTKYATFL